MDYKNVKNTISRNISFFRKKNGITQKELADALHTKQNTVSNWESGRCIPDADTLVSICSFLHVSINDMYGIESEDPRAISYNEWQMLLAYRKADNVEREMVRRALGLQEKEAAASSVS